MAETIKFNKEIVFYKTIHRKIKHPRIEFKTGILTLIIPKDWNETEKDLLLKHEKWILTKHGQIKSSLDTCDGKELKKDRDLKTFKDFVRGKVCEYQNIHNSEIKRLDFKTMKTKWASCSSNRIVTVNTLMKYLPDKLIEYVMYHEMAHLRERKHNKHFWNIVEKKFKNPELMEKDLMMYWFLIQKQVF